MLALSLSLKPPQLSRSPAGTAVTGRLAARGQDALAGEVPIPADFNLGHYFLVVW